MTIPDEKSHCLPATQNWRYRSVWVHPAAVVAVMNGAQEVIENLKDTGIELKAPHRLHGMTQEV